MTQNGHQQCSAQIKTAFLVNVAQRDSIVYPFQQSARRRRSAMQKKANVKSKLWNDKHWRIVHPFVRKIWYAPYCPWRCRTNETQAALCTADDPQREMRSRWRGPKSERSAEPQIGPCCFYNRILDRAVFITRVSKAESAAFFFSILLCLVRFGRLPLAWTSKPRSTR